MCRCQASCLRPATHTSWQRSQIVTIGWLDGTPYACPSHVASSFRITALRYGGLRGEVRCSRDGLHFYTNYIGLCVFSQYFYVFDAWLKVDLANSFERLCRIVRNAAVSITSMICQTSGLNSWCSCFLRGLFQILALVLRLALVTVRFWFSSISVLVFRDYCLSVIIYSSPIQRSPTSSMR
jgi:hypothetical protein